MEKNMLEFVLRISHYSLPVLAVAVLLLCLSPLLKRKPPSLGKARLINASGGDEYPLVSRETSIGSHKNCDIIFDSADISRVCAVIICAKSGWYITKVKSATEVKVNGKVLEKKELLKTNDKISFGNITLIFDNKQG